MVRTSIVRLSFHLFLLYSGADETLHLDKFLSSNPLLFPFIILIKLDRKFRLTQQIYIFGYTQTVQIFTNNPPPYLQWMNVDWDERGQYWWESGMNCVLLHCNSPKYFPSSSFRLFASPTNVPHYSHTFPPRPFSSTTEHGGPQSPHPLSLRSLLVPNNPPTTSSSIHPFIPHNPSQKQPSSSTTTKSSIVHSLLRLLFLLFSTIIPPSATMCIFGLAAGSPRRLWALFGAGTLWEDLRLTPRVHHTFPSPYFFPAHLLIYVCKIVFGWGVWKGKCEMNHGRTKIQLVTTGIQRFKGFTDFRPQQNIFCWKCGQPNP